MGAERKIRIGVAALFFVTMLLAFSGVCGSLAGVLPGMQFAPALMRCLTAFSAGALAAVLGAVGAAVLSGMPGMQTGRMRPWVILYAAFVSALLGKGLQLAFGIAQPWCFLVLTGAALFWVSDLLILFLYFYRTSHPAVHAANLATYYYGMFLVAISLGF